MDKIHETIIFKTLYNKQWRTVIPERQERNKVTPMTVLAYWCPLQPQGRQMNIRGIQNSSWGDKAERTKAPRFARQHTRKEKASQRKNYRNQQRVSLEYPAHMWGNQPKPGERIRGNSTWYSHSAGNSACSHQPGKPHNSRAIG